MENERYTESGLYRTSKEVVETFFRDYFQRAREEKGEYIFKEMADKLSSQDPNLDIFFERAYKEMGMEGGERDYFILGAGCMYELLRRQAESNSLEERSK